MASLSSFDAKERFRSVKFGCIVALLFAAIMVITVTEAERENFTSKSFSWSTSMEENDAIGDSSESVGDVSAGADGGFSSLDGMLQWAIGHSDPVKLKETARDVQRMSQEELQKRQVEIKELMEKLKSPSDAKLMQIAIDDLNNNSISLEDRDRALQELLILVEPIDNANDLNKMGGLFSLIRELHHNDSHIRTISAWVIGKASQNNPVVQKQVLELGGLNRLMEMVESTSAEEAIKALYAVSALIRNNINGQEQFYAQSGVKLIQGILSSKNVDIRLCKKAVLFVSDLAESHPEDHEVPFVGNELLLKSVVDLMTSADLDLMEKTLGAIKSVIRVKRIDIFLLKDGCFLDKMLEKVKRQLEELMMDEFQKDYAADVEILRMEVEVIFKEKLSNSGYSVK